MSKAFVIIAQQYDRSALEVLRVYLEQDSQQAKDDANMLLKVSEKNIIITEAEIYGDTRIIK